MAKRKITEQQQAKKDAGREMSVYKRDDMIQKARYTLSPREQKCVLYAISRIKPTDNAFVEYTFNLREYYDICGLADESYTELKGILKGLRDRSWWVEIDDKGTESAVSWFTTVRTNKRSGKVTIKFHEDMMPFLLELAKQAQLGEFYTGYKLQYVLPMSSQFSPRLYELLKSYQKNNREWFFDIDDLKRVLDCQNYKNFNDFKKRALDPAVEEINQYTDLNVAFDTVREGRGGKVTRVIFYMANKTPERLVDTHLHISETLDGQMTMDDYRRATEEMGVSVKAQFYKDNPIRPARKPPEGF